jgi:hypothetical protein
MAQGKAVDYAIVSPAHMSTFSQGGAVHRRAVPVPRPRPLEQGARRRPAEADRRRGRAEGRGHADRLCRRRHAQHLRQQAGANLAEIKGLKVRVQGAPIWSKTFAAVGMSPTVIAYNEVYNAIQNGVIQAGENEAAGVEQMKFYEVAPQPAMTQHAITIRPLCFSGKTFKKLPKPICRRRSSRPARRPAPMAARSSRARTAKLDALEKAGKLKRIPFKDRDAMKKLVDPVMAAYAKEIGADGSSPRSTRQVARARRRPRGAPARRAPSSGHPHGELSPHPARVTECR